MLLRKCLALLLPLAAAYKPISEKSIKSIPSPGSDFDILNGKLLAPILKPRVPGTQGSSEVLQHFLEFFKSELPGWTLELHNSTSTTPATGDKLIPFVNLIATRDPPWSTPGHVGRLVLSAHYDTLIQPEGFIGAIDSAAPCAMIMHAARSLDKALTAKWEGMKAANIEDDAFRQDEGVQIILFDGEEAFVSWTDTDSIYGSRALADTWESQLYPAMSTYRSPLAAIDLFLLLDLLGSKDPRIPSYFLTTHWAYQAMADLESRLRDLQLFKSSPNHPSKLERSPSNDKPKRKEPKFLPDAKKEANQFQSSFIGDDHVPFMERGVHILHMIPTPFPEVWHNVHGIPDDGEHLDMDTVEDWALLVTAFTAEWLELEDYMHGAGSNSNNNARDQPHAKRDSVISKTEL